MNRKPYRIADSPRVSPFVLPVGIEFEDVCTALLARLAKIADVGGGAYGDVHLASIAAEPDVARPVAAAPQASAAGKVGHDHLGRPGRMQGAVLVRESNDRTGVPDVEPFRVRPRGIERKTERLVEPPREDFARGGLTVGGAPTQNSNLSAIALGDEEVAVRGGDNLARSRQAGRIEFNLEPFGGFRPRSLGSAHDPGTVVGAPRLERLRQVGDDDLAPNSR